MPQFDFFAWASVGFWTVVSFHIFYFFILRCILAPFAEIQKFQQKILIKISNSENGVGLKDLFLKKYFKK